MNNYIEQKQINKAVYGSVILCIHEEDGTFAAVKKMSRHHMRLSRSFENPSIRVREDGDKEQAIHQFLNKNPHEHIVKMIEIYQDEQYDHVVMEYCAMGELYDHLLSYSNHRLPMKMAKTYLTQICKGLKHLHDLKIAHRDISLENILLDKEFKCKLTDYGLATFNGNVCTERVGKSFYMAPEIIELEENEQRFYDGLKGDMWSLGIVLFILLTGIPPIQKASLEDSRFCILKNHGVSKLVQLWQLENVLSAEAIDLLSKLLTVNPHRRISIDRVLQHPFITNEKGLKKTYSDISRQLESIASVVNITYLDSVSSFNTDSTCDELILNDASYQQHTSQKWMNTFESNQCHHCHFKFRFYNRKHICAHCKYRHCKNCITHDHKHTKLCVMCNS